MEKEKIKLINKEKFYLKTLELIEKNIGIKNILLNNEKNVDKKIYIKLQIKEFEKDIKKIKKYYLVKKDFIYIYFHFLSLINYNEKIMLKLPNLEITKSNYNYFLEVLPPLKFYNRGFISSEFYSGGLTNYFYEIKKKFYVKIIDIENLEN